MKKLSLLLSLSFLIFTVACSDDDDDACNTDDITYTNDIKPIYEQSCTTAGCHATGSDNIWPMDTYELSVGAVGFGCIENVIQHLDQENCTPMPIGGDKLEDCDIDKILAWIDAGMPE